MNHPDNAYAPNRCSWESYQERVDYKGYPHYYDYAQPSAIAIQRAIKKLGMSAIPQYQHGPWRPKNSEIIPIQ